MPNSEPNELTVLLEGRGVFAAHGSRVSACDRVGCDAVAQRMVSNSIQALQPGEGNYNFLLNAQGRIQGDATVYREPADSATFCWKQTLRNWERSSSISTGSSSWTMSSSLPLENSPGFSSQARMLPPSLWHLALPISGPFPVPPEHKSHRRRPSN